ncbi:MAG TPA: adenylate/guanylate cyclase domain-containing protein [candidate division Zixibacteria bacterium]|nr:adenylate/guanylate cyclase domain-containing protein [candidate division Zixibacteria bacterium]
MELIACPSCGEENPSKFRLCGFCGAPLAPALPPQEERKVVTVFFSDLKGSTNLGEALDPESLREVMSTYFERMTRVLHRHGATIEKFIGDAIMAVFGLPRLHEDDALRAVRAALETKVAVAELNRELQARYGVQLTVRTGVNTGEVVAGDPSAGQRLVTGDTVNVAARLEQAAPPGEILIGGLTYRLVRGAVEAEPVEPLELKGKSEPVPAYRLLAVSDATEGFERRQDGPMVGRDAEMAALSAILRRAIDERRCRTATIVADAGVGKSRLVREFTAAHAAEANVVRGRCLPYGEGITFWPLVEAAREAAVIEGDDSPEVARAKLAKLTGDEEITARLASAIGLSDVQYPVTEIFWAARRFLEALGRERPLIVVVDDIHWAEPTFLELIGHLVQTVEDASVLLLCTSRPDLLDRQPDWATDADSQRLVLSPLTDDDAAKVVAGLLGEAGIAGEAQERIVLAAEGNPLFVEQLLSMMIDTGALHFADGRWEPTGDLADLEVPPSIHALLAARLDLLAREERAVIEPASVIGLTFAQGAVSAIAPEPVRPRVPDHLVSMTRKQLVRPNQPTAPGDMAAPDFGTDDVTYRFQHLLIRDAAYGALLKRVRATYHEAFADWADEQNRRQGRSQEYEEILGYHLEQAYHYRAELGVVDDHARSVGARAAAKLGSAGRRAMTRGDMHAAANLLRRAAAVLPEDSAARRALLPDLGEALTELGEFEAAQRVLDGARQGAARAGDAAGEARAELAQLLLKLYAAEEEDWSEAAIDAVKRAMPVFAAAEQHEGLAQAARVEALVHGSANRFADAAAAAERMVDEARTAGSARLERRGAVVYAQSALFGPTPVPDAIRRCEELLATVRGDRRSEALVRSPLALLYAMTGQFDRARTTYAEARKMLTDLGTGLLAAATSTWLAQIEILAGGLETAEAELRQDHTALSALGERFLLPTVAGFLGRVLLLRGDLDGAEAMTREAENVAAPDDADAQALWREVRAQVLARRGQHADALRLAEEAVAIRRRSDAPALLAEALADLGDVRRLAGDEAAATAAHAEAAELYRAKGDVASVRRVEGARAAAADA